MKIRSLGAIRQNPKGVGKIRPFHRTRELRDELGVAGHIVMIRPIVGSSSTDVPEMRIILDAWEKQGWHKFDDVPENEPTKDRFRQLAKATGFDVRF